MNNDLVERALAQARELQKNVASAVAQTGENMKPLIEQSMQNAQALQKTLAEHATEVAKQTQSQAQTTTAAVQENTNKAMGHLAEFMKVGADALKSGGEQARAATATMMEQTKKTIESATAAMGKKPEDAGH